MNEEIMRKNPLCVISKATFGKYAVHDIQTNSIWTGNPYGEEYANVPDGMVQDILATRGFCDIVLNEEGTEVVSFTAREIPEIQEEPEETEQTTEERLSSLEETTTQQGEILNILLSGEVGDSV